MVSDGDARAFECSFDVKPFRDRTMREMVWPLGAKGEGKSPFSISMLEVVSSHHAMEKGCEVHRPREGIVRKMFCPGVKWKGRAS